MKRLATVAAAALLLTACGDDEPSGNNIITTNNQVDNNATTNSGTNNTAANATTNNSSANVVANNESTNNSVFEGYDPTGILALEGAGNPAGLPCEATATLAFGQNVVTSTDRYGYDAEGRLLFLDTFEDGAFITREARRYDAGTIAEIVTVDAELELTELVQVYGYDADGRPDQVELAVPDQSGVLGPAIETVEYSYASNTEWSTTSLDDEGNMLSTASYSWDEGNLTFVETDNTGAETSLVFAAAPDLINLYSNRFLEVFEYGQEIVSGAVDDDANGTPESTISTTYDGGAIQTFEVATQGGGSISFVFAYECQ